MNTNLWDFFPTLKKSLWGQLVLSLGLLCCLNTAIQATGTNCATVTEIPQAECETLVALYNSTDGANWSDSPANNWNVTNTPCSWWGVSCQAGNVINIYRGQNNLVGTIPDLSALTNLQILYLEENQLSGPIPDLSSLNNLENIQLINNQLSGSIPDLSALTNLKILQLGHNGLSGSIPDLSSLTNLQQIHLGDNELSGSIPNLNALINLDEIKLFDNQLSGSIPNLSALTNLKTLNLDNNQLSGSIPDLSTLTNLEDLNLGENQLTGSIPDLSTLTNLEVIDLQDNQLSGSIPDLSALTNLEQLYLDANQLSGSIPDLSALTNLEVLYLGDNQLSGSIPDLSTLTNLKEFELQFNQISGFIPDLSALTILKHILLFNNQLTGSIPDLSTLNLESLMLAHNQLTGPIPVSLTTQNNLYRLHIENNDCLTASDSSLIAFLNNLNPQWVNQACLVERLQFSSNNYTVNETGRSVTITVKRIGSNGAVSVDYASSDGTATASDYTAISGTLNWADTDNTDKSFTLNISDDSLVEGNETVNLTLSNVIGETALGFPNQTVVTIIDDEPAIPDVFCTNVTEIPQAECQALVALYNSTNGPNWSDSPENNWKITTTPCQWEGVHCQNGHVSELDREEENLVGSIPNLSALSDLQYLVLSVNSLSGPIPDLNGLTNLQEIYLDWNELSGSIPNFSGLTNLQEFSLETNQLTGPIPDFSGLNNLQNLWLAGNQLSGSIPNFSGLSNLQILALWGNELSGPIPDFTNLLQLRRLHLGWNQLTGSIPDLSHLSNLEQLSLNNNHLSGAIPLSLMTLSNLSNLALEYNDCLSATDPGLIAFLNNLDPMWVIQSCSLAGVRGHVELQGRPEAPDPAWITELRVSLTVPGETEPRYHFTPTTDDSGWFSLGGVVELGNYDIRVKGTHTLQNLINVTLETGENEVDFGTLLEGDANDDNVVTILDFSILASTFGKAEADPDFDARADFNQDGVVTILDFSLLASNFGQGGAPEPSMAAQFLAVASMGTVEMAVIPDQTKVNVGDTFELLVEINAGNQEIDGASAYLNFDPTVMRVDEIISAGVLNLVLLNHFDNQTGQITFSAGALESKPSGRFKLAIIRMKAIAVSKGSALNFNTQWGQSAQVTSGGASVLAQAKGGMVVIVGPASGFVNVPNFGAKVILDFGSGNGLWMWINNNGWTYFSAESMVTANLDGKIPDDVIIDFGPDYGIWLWMNNSTWVQLHSLSSESLVTGDLDGNGQDDIIIDFGADFGIWLLMNNKLWVHLHSNSPESLITRDLDGNGQDEVIIDFGSAGIWQWFNNSFWVQLHNLSSQ